MAKRFTDTELYSKAWFRRLPVKVKCLWEWMRSRCDSAGVLEFDLELASFQIGEEILESDLDLLSSHVKKIGDSKIWITDFISFQYGELKENYNPHKPVFKSIKKHDLVDDIFQGLPKASPSLIYQDQYQDKDKDKEEDKEKESVEIEKSNSSELLNFVLDHWNKILVPKMKNGKPWSRNMLTSAMLRDFSDSCSAFKSRSDWEAMLRKVEDSDYLLGEAQSAKKAASLSWVLNYDNGGRIAAGEFDNEGSNESELVLGKYYKSTIRAAMQSHNMTWDEVVAELQKGMDEEKAS
jgi:hypothetical protein